MTKAEAKELLNKYMKGECTPEEKGLVEHWYLSESSKQSLPDDQEDFSPEKMQMWDEISEMSDLQNRRKRSGVILWGTSIAAAVLLIFSISNNFFIEKEEALISKKENVQVFDKEAGSNKAVLTLGDGSKIILDDALKGNIAIEGGISIRKSSDGSIVYDIPELAVRNSKSVPYNTIETPKGGKYQVILPDGSIVWLNAGSLLRFPAIFTGNERNVELSGEAYFEVAKNIDMPFNVRTKNMNIHVTGTQFNVMAYNDESYSAATLVEGSVQVSNPSQKLFLQPGEQVLANETSNLSKRDADIEETIAWKNGLFQFNNSDIHTVMNQISRWYDVSIEYRGRVPEKHFGGYISRESKLSQVLKMLELSGVRFSIEEKKIIVLP